MKKLKVEPKKKVRRVRNSLNRTEILTAALHIIQKNGIENLSMRTIAKHLKCSVASPYAHFKSQEEIIQELLFNGEQKLTADLNIARTSSDNPLEQIKAIANTYWQFSVENQGLHKLMFSAGEGYIKNYFLPRAVTVSSFELFGMD